MDNIVGEYGEAIRITSPDKGEIALKNDIIKGTIYVKVEVKTATGDIIDNLLELPWVHKYSWYVAHVDRPFVDSTLSGARREFDEEILGDIETMGLVEDGLVDNPNEEGKNVRDVLETERAETSFYCPASNVMGFKLWIWGEEFREQGEYKITLRIDKRTGGVLEIDKYIKLLW